MVEYSRGGGGRVWWSAVEDKAWHVPEAGILRALVLSDS